MVGFAGKSGVYILLDAKTGAFVWSSLIGPGGDQGGMEWRTATDGERIYVSITNHHHITYRLTSNGVLTNRAVTGGSWAALDPDTGRILWQTADPQVETLPGVGVVGVWELAPVTVAHGVLYAASMAKLAFQNQMFALWAGEKLGMSAHAILPTMLHDTRSVEATTADRVEVVTMIRGGLAAPAPKRD